MRFFLSPFHCHWNLSAQNADFELLICLYAMFSATFQINHSEKELMQDFNFNKQLLIVLKIRTHSIFYWWDNQCFFDVVSVWQTNIFCSSTISRRLLSHPSQQALCTLVELFIQISSLKATINCNQRKSYKNAENQLQIAFYGYSIKLFSVAIFELSMQVMVDHFSKAQNQPA